MQFNPNDLVTPEIILFDVLEETSDKDFREMTRGWYVGQIQNALSEIEFDTRFNTLFYDQAIPDDLRMEVPRGCFNVDDVYIYNGKLKEPSAPPKPLWWKRRMLRAPGSDYSANLRGGVAHEWSVTPASTYENKLFFNITNRVIDLSSSCASYEFIRIVYNGTSIPIGSVPFVPPFLRRYVHMFCVENFWRVMKGRYKDEPRNRTNWSDAYGILYGDGGLKDQAVVRMKKLDSKFRRDLMEYLSRMNY